MAADREAQLWVPPFPLSVGNVWRAWQRVRRRKGAGPHGLAPIEWTDIDAFVRLSRVPLAPFDISLIEDLDDLFLLKMAEPPKPLDQAEVLKDGLKSLGRKHQK